MLNFLKKYLIAHEGNNHEPHLLRDSGALFLFVVIIGSFALGAGGHYLITRTDLTSLVLSSVLVDYTNQNRDTQSYSHLVISPVLEKAAQMKARDMAEKGYFAHNSPDGKTPWYWFRQAGYDFAYAGENLAVNFNESAEVSNAWMNSPGHRANILNEKFTEIGIATAQGYYQGKPTTFVVQLFGRPTKTLAQTATIVSSKTNTAPIKEDVVVKTVEPRVLSESVSNELFVAVENADKVLGSTSLVKSDVKYSAFYQRVLASPKKYLGVFYSIVSLAIMISLFSLLFIEIKKEHNRMIILSIGLIFVMFILLYYFKVALFSQIIVA